MLRHELAAMASLGCGGAIVNVGSTLSVRGGTNASAYSASKHAVLGSPARPRSSTRRRAFASTPSGRARSIRR